MNSQSFDNRADGFRQIGDVIRSVAVHHSKVDVDEITHERWRQLMGLMRELDTYNDALTHNWTDSTRSSMRLLTDASSPFFDRYPALFPDTIEPKSYEALVKRARSIINLGQFATATHNLNHFVAIRTLEAKQTANLLYDSASPFVKTQPAFFDSFMPLARSYAIGANFYDTFIDARRDYEQKQLKIKPDTTFYRRVGLLALKHMVPVTKAAFHPAVLKDAIPKFKQGAFNTMTYDENGQPIRNVN